MLFLCAINTYFCLYVRTGFIYRLDVLNEFGSLLTPLELEAHYLAIKEDADERYEKIRDRQGLDRVETEASLNIPALTTYKRDKWATFRKKYFSFGSNKRNLSMIEDAIMFVVLDDAKDEVKEWNGRGKSLFCGNGRYTFNDILFYFFCLTYTNTNADLFIL